MDNLTFRSGGQLFHILNPDCILRQAELGHNSNSGSKLRIGLPKFCQKLHIPV